jgi:hypothetical protein
VVVVSPLERGGGRSVNSRVDEATAKKAAILHHAKRTARSGYVITGALVLTGVDTDLRL